jgi:D-xylonolactonase
VEPEIIADCSCETGEGPLWHPLEQRLYWVDIPAGKLFRWDPAGGRVETCIGGDGGGDAIGGFTVQPDGALLLFMARGAIKLWRGGRLTTIVAEVPEERGGRFNDVIADPAGRVFCGTMPIGDRPGSLYRLDTTGALTRVLDDAGLSNGMAFSRDWTQFFHTDSKRRVIRRFDFDASSGAITNPSVFAEVPEAEGVPDGLTMDAEGYLWSARWDGSCVVRYAPDGAEERRVALPVKKVSCAAFGGPGYDELYVTTAGGNRKAEEGMSAGALFRLRPGVRGMPELFSRAHAG